jgi:hypothetical protein
MITGSLWSFAIYKDLYTGPITTRHVSTSEVASFGKASSGQRPPPRPAEPLTRWELCCSSGLSIPANKMNEDTICYVIGEGPMPRSQGYYGLSPFTKIYTPDQLQLDTCLPVKLPHLGRPPVASDLQTRWELCCSSGLSIPAK